MEGGDPDFDKIKTHPLYNPKGYGVIKVHGITSLFSKIIKKFCMLLCGHLFILYHHS